MRYLIFMFLFAAAGNLHSQQIALLKYRGGGDWYARPKAPSATPFSATATGSSIQVPSAG